MVLAQVKLCYQKYSSDAWNQQLQVFTHPGIADLAVQTLDATAGFGNDVEAQSLQAVPQRTRADAVRCVQPFATSTHDSSLTQRTKSRLVATLTEAKDVKFL